VLKPYNWYYQLYMVRPDFPGDVSKPSAMISEAAEAARVASAQLAWWSEHAAGIVGRLRTLDPRQIITCGRGSSDHSATYAKYLIETMMRISVSSYAPSTSSIYGVELLGLERTVFIVISQSGRSSDLLLSARTAKKAGALVCAIVNEVGSPLADVADLTIPQLAGKETSVAATKSYIASLFSVVLLVGYWAKDALLLEAASTIPDMLERSWSNDWTIGARAFADTRNMYVIGRGPTFGIAQEAALKLKETCGIHAEAFSAAEVRHGPMELVRRGFPVLMFVPGDQAASGFAALAQDFAARGANVVVAGASLAGTTELPTLEHIHPALSALCMIESFYKMAAQISSARGLDPDRPVHLRKVTDTL